MGSTMIRAMLCCLLLTGLAVARDRFVLLPLDNRPCNVLFVRQLAGIAMAEVVTPPNHWLGSWLNPGKCEQFVGWLETTAQAGDTLIVSSDMLCYGGLVASRMASTPEQSALDRLECLKRLHQRGLRVEVLSTIPRLYLRTSEGQAPFETDLADWAARADADSPPPPSVPVQWVDEYLQVRRRNLQVLLRLVDMAREGVIDQLVVGQDDSSSHGLHFAEQVQLRERLDGAPVWLGSGADELTMDMVCGRLAQVHNVQPKLELEYSEAGSERRIPPLESHPLQDMVLDHLRLCGAEPVSLGGDVRLFIQVPAAKPFALPGPDQRPRSYAFVERVREWMDKGHPPALAALAFINRMDPYLAEAVVERLPLTQLEGFAAWNTPANSLGTVVAQVVARRVADQLSTHSPIAQVKQSARLHVAFLLARLIDDYGYQTMVRGEFYPQARGLTPNPDPLVSPYLKLGREVRVRLIEWARKLYRDRFEGRRLSLPGRRGTARLGELSLQVVLPWPRLFEVEVRLDVRLQPDQILLP
ncbi:DUF4127 family protein [bacterium]|nr:DUF4127 family protein [bacterium]